MGADIYFYMEVEVDGVWQHYPVAKFAPPHNADSIEIARYYPVFAILGYGYSHPTSQAELPSHCGGKGQIKNCYCCACHSNDGDTVDAQQLVDYRWNHSWRVNFPVRMLPRQHSFADCQLSSTVRSHYHDDGDEHSPAVLMASELLNQDFWQRPVSCYQFIRDDADYGEDDEDINSTTYNNQPSAYDYYREVDPDRASADKVELPFDPDSPVNCYRDFCSATISELEVCIEMAMMTVADLNKIRFVYWFIG